MKKIVLIMIMIAGAAFACPKANGSMEGCGCMAPPSEKSQSKKEQKEEYKCPFEKKGHSCSKEYSCKGNSGK